MAERLPRLLQGVAIGPPLGDGVFMGPLISQRAYQKVIDLRGRGAIGEGERILSVDPGLPAPFIGPGLVRYASAEQTSAYQREEMIEILQESTRAARWPQVSIGAGGSTLPPSLLGSQWVALITPQISFPSLDPQTKIRLQLSEVDLETSEKQYKKAVLEAINEVASAMVNLNKHETQLANEAKRLLEYQNIQKNVKIRFDAGFANRVELLGAGLDLLAINQRQLDLYAQRLLDQINLHNALGGGW